MPAHQSTTQRAATEADIASTVWDIADALGHLLRLSASSFKGLETAPLRAAVSRIEKRAGELGRGDLASLLAEAHRVLRDTSGQG